MNLSQPTRVRLKQPDQDKFSTIRYKFHGQAGDAKNPCDSNPNLERRNAREIHIFL
jgi:hypothetical protein